MTDANFSAYTARLFATLYSPSHGITVRQNNNNNNNNKCDTLGNIRLDVYQRFVSQYLFRMQPDDVHGLLLFHNTGSGKTCTSVDVVAEYFANFPTQTHAYVLLPTKKDVAMYVTQLKDLCPSVRRRYKVAMEIDGGGGIQALDRDFVRVRLGSALSGRSHDVIVLDMKTYARARVRDTVKPRIPGIGPKENVFESTLVIVDEADVVLRCETLGYETPTELVVGAQAGYKKLNVPQTVLNDMGKTAPRKNRNTNPLTVHTRNNKPQAFPTKARQLILMTATPYVDDSNDVFALLRCVKPYAADNQRLFEGTVSFVDNRTDYGLYPRVAYTPLAVSLDPNLENRLTKYMAGTKNGNNLEKAISVECAGPKCRTRTLGSIAMEDVPKIAKLMDVLEQTPADAKHLVYVHEKHMGSRIVEHILKTQSAVGKRVAVVTSQNPDKAILRAFNSPDNKRGEKIRLLIIQGKAFVRATTFKAVRFLHILTPLIDPNEHNQLIGRVARRCSHDQLPKADWNVTVWMYHFDTAANDNSRRSANERGMLQRTRKLHALTEMIEYAKHKAVDRDIMAAISNSNRHTHSLLDMVDKTSRNRWVPNDLRFRGGVPPTSANNNRRWMNVDTRFY